MAMNILKLEIYFSLILYSRDDAGMGVFKWLIKVKGIENQPKSILCFLKALITHECTYWCESVSVYQ